MRQIDLQKAAVISQGQLDLLGRANVAHAPIRGRKQARGDCKIIALQIVAVFMQIGERHGIGNSGFDVELDVTTSEEHEHKVGVFLFLRPVNVECQRSFIVQFDLRDGDRLPAGAFAFTVGVPCGRN